MQADQRGWVGEFARYVNEQYQAACDETAEAFRDFAAAWSETER